jgi:hypothetical protein
MDSVVRRARVIDHHRLEDWVWKALVARIPELEAKVIRTEISPGWGLRLIEKSRRRVAATLNATPGALGSFSALLVYAHLVAYSLASLCNVREVVLHLLWDKEAGRGLGPCMPEGCVWAHTAYSKYLSSRPPVRLTVVGGEQEFRRAIGVDEQASADAVNHAVHTAASYYCSKNGCWEDVAEWCSAIRTVSPEEYAQEVGEVQVARETRSNPYIGVPVVYLP